MRFINCILATVVFITTSLSAQVVKDTSKVLMSTIKEKYTGPVKKGLASGQGEAFGVHHYIGMFKNGMPNGKGIYYYNDSVYYKGEFLDGVKEGKGEMHNAQKQGADTLIKGYWSGDEYRGKSYNTYAISGANNFDNVDVNYSASSGNRINFEIATTSGSPNPMLAQGNTNYVLSITELISLDNPSKVRFLSDYKSGLRAYWTFEILTFPIKLQVKLSNGRFISLDLYKSADWNVKLYMNK